MENYVADSFQEQAAPVPQRPSWTEERVDLLRQLIDDGETARVAGAMLGITRNAAIGKALRLGLHFGDGSHSPKRGRGNPKRITRVFAQNKQRWKERNPVRVSASAPEPLNLTLLDLQSGQCKYAVTDDKPHLFCGQPTPDGASYCDYHHGICHMEPRK